MSASRHQSQIPLRFSLHNIGDGTRRSSQQLCANTTTPNFVILVGHACHIQPYATPYRGLMGIQVGLTIIWEALDHQTDSVEDF
jgi:hypothetical protein